MTSAIFTLGYARATQDALIDVLLQSGVEQLVDVRALPLSRRPGFSKTSLKASVEHAGMAYRHFKHLGTPKDGRDAARRGDLATLRQVYEGQLALPEALAQMAEIRDLAATAPICLLCYCEETTKCHRGLLIEAAFADWQCQDLYTASGPT